MKSKIARKLSYYFAAALLLFSIVIGGVFTVLFRSHTLSLQRQELETRAQSIADTMVTYLQGGHGHDTAGGYGAYFRFLDEIAGANAWVVDAQRNVLTSGHMMGMGGCYRYSDLPANAEQLINRVFENQTVFSQDFSEVLSELTLTVGVPIRSRIDGELLGVVLLHTPAKGVDNAVLQGISLLLISLVAALLVSVLLSTVLSWSFTRPLSVMKNNALQLASGHYNVQNRIRQPDEIGELAETLDVLADRLEQASRESEKLEQLRRDFVANVSHELRTPVTVMRGSLEALADGIVTDPQKVSEYYRQMLREATFLQRLVGDLLELSRLQSVDFAIEQSTFSLYDVMDDAARSAGQLAAAKQVTIEIRKDSPDRQLTGDYGRFRQMLLIVLDNAVKFSPENEVVGFVLTPQEICITDCGLGIAPESLPHIFDRFYKARSEENKTGTGLGLAIAMQIAQRHGISMRAENAADGGAVFTFVLPD